MQLFISPTAGENAVRVARCAAEFIRCNPGSLLCLAAGDTPLPAYACLVDMQAAGEVDLSSVFYVGLDEWMGLGSETRGSCRQVMDAHFYQPAHIPEERRAVWNGHADAEAKCARISAFIEAHGGIGFTVLGLGMNGHVGFNEPGTGLSLGCIRVELDATTRSVSAKYFDTPMPVQWGVSIGAGTLKAARTLVLMADGSRKAPILHRALAQPPTDAVPASLLADHPDLRVFLDEAAAAQLPPEIRRT